MKKAKKGPNKKEKMVEKQVENFNKLLVINELKRAKKGPKKELQQG